MKRSAQIPLNLHPDAVYSFENFIVASSNADALKILRAWPAWPSPVLFLLGPSGSGKTHLGKAWAGAHEGVEFIDDAHLQDEMALFETINAALAGVIPGLLLCAPQLPRPAMPDLCSRYKAIPKALLHEHDDDSLEPIVRKLFSECGREVSRDVVQYILSYTDRSVSALRRLVLGLDSAASAAKSDVTKRFVGKYLEQDQT